MTVTVPPPTTVLADVALLHGFRAHLTPPLRVLHAPAAAVRGEALTVTLADGPGADGLAPIHELLSSDLRGRVLVMGGAPLAEGAAFGQILARAARRAGAVAAVIDGAVRDVQLLPAEELPVVALSEHTAGAVGLVHVAATGRRLRAGGVPVDDGDVVVVDDGGAVSLPRRLAERLLDDGVALAAAEARVLDELAEGAALLTAYSHKRRAVARIRGAVTGGAAPAPDGEVDDMGAAPISSLTLQRGATPEAHGRGEPT